MESLRSANGEGVQEEHRPVDDHQRTGGDGIALPIALQDGIVPLVDHQGSGGHKGHAANQRDEGIEALLHQRVDHMTCGIGMGIGISVISEGFSSVADRCYSPIRRTPQMIVKPPMVPQTMRGREDKAPTTSYITMQQMAMAWRGRKRDLINC